MKEIGNKNTHQHYRVNQQLVLSSRLSFTFSVADQRQSRTRLGGGERKTVVDTERLPSHARHGSRLISRKILFSGKVRRTRKRAVHIHHGQRLFRVTTHQAIAGVG